MKFRLLFLFALLGIASLSSAQISITSSGATQNFDGIGTTATASLPTNWKMTAAGDSAPTWASATNVTTTTQGASSGTPATGGRYNWGNGTITTDRAIGFMSSGSYNSPNSIMAFFQNNTGSTMTSATISFDFERYRINTAACAITFFYSTDGSTWTAAAAGDSGVFTTAANAYTFTGGTVVSKNFTLTGISVANTGSF